MKGGQEQHVPHQVVLELVVADEGCEGTQAELQGEDHFGGGLEPGGGRGHGGPVGAMRTVMLSGPLHSMHARMLSESDQQHEGGGHGEGGQLV